MFAGRAGTLRIVALVAALGAALIWKVHGGVTLPPQFIYDSDRAVSAGNHYFSKEVYDIDYAEKYFRRAIDINPRVSDAWHQIARIDFLRGHFSEALDEINTQISIHGSGLMASYYIRGLILGYMGRFPEAEDDFKKFIGWNPDSWAGWNDLAWVYFAQGKYAEAADAAEQGLERHSGNPWLLNSYGAALLNLKRYEDATRVFTYAKEVVGVATEETWQQAYPGNSPEVAVRGLAAFRETVNHNLELAIQHSW